MAKSLEEVMGTLLKNKTGLYEQYKIKELGIFGSLVRGQEQKRSDIDILVEFEEIPDHAPCIPCYYRNGCCGKADCKSRRLVLQTI